MPPKSSGDDDRSISLILPAWNEREGISTAILEADAALGKIASRYEIIVVDDGSTDGTGTIVDQIALSRPAVRLVRHAQNLGYGAALRSGFAAAEMDLVVFTDADCQFDLTELDRFVLLSQQYDVVCGYRIDRKDTPLRCIYSAVYNQLVRLLLRTGVRDVDCAMKMFRRDVAKDLTISGNGFLVNSELLTQAKQQGRTVVEVGVSHRARTHGASTVSIDHIPRVLRGLVRYWWNTVQFPGDAQTTCSDLQSNESTQKIDQRFALLQWAMLLFAAVFLFTNLGYPLIDRDETRYAEISREMVITGNWVLPQLNFETYYDKPPLVYWLCAISFSLFGTSEASARIIPALAALLTIASTMFFASRIFDKRVGAISGAVLMLSIGFIFTSRYLLLDGVLTLLVSVSLLTAYEAIRSGRLKLGWWFASGVCCGLALLTKGPLALVLWLPPVFLFAWLSDRCAKPKWWHYGLIGGTAAAITLPWVVAVSQQDSKFLFEFVYRHNVARFAGEFHRKPIWFFIPVLLVAGHPWSFLTIPYGRFLFGQSDEVRLRRPPAIGFMLLWSAWCFLFFSLSLCKLPTYLMPAAPALAMMIGQYLDQVLHDRSNCSRHWFARFWSARTATSTTCLAGVGFVVFSVVSRNEVSLGIFAWGVLWTSLLVSSLILLRDRQNGSFAWRSSTVVVLLLAVMVMHHLLPEYSRSKSLFEPSSSVGRHLAGQSKPAIATVAHEFSEIPFYLDRSDIPNFSHVKEAELKRFVSENESCLLVIKNDINPEHLRRQLPVGAILKDLGERGSARLLEVEMAPTKRVAKRSELVR